MALWFCAKSLGYGLQFLGVSHVFSSYLTISQNFSVCGESFETTCTSHEEVSCTRTEHHTKKRKRGGPDWLDGKVVSLWPMADESTTAQVHPGKLTRALMEAPEQKGARLLKATVTGLCLDPSGTRIEGVLPETAHGNVCPYRLVADAGEHDPHKWLLIRKFGWVGVRVPARDGGEGVEVGGGGDVVAARVCVLALGPWTSRAGRWLPSLPEATALKAHSIVLKPPEPCPPTFLFLSFRPTRGVVLNGDEEEVLPARSVVLAMGPWTDKARAWLKGLPALSRHKYYSVVLQPSTPVPGDCPFTTFVSSAGGRSSPPSQPFLPKRAWPSATGHAPLVEVICPPRSKPHWGGARRTKTMQVGKAGVDTLSAAHSFWFPTLLGIADPDSYSPLNDVGWVSCPTWTSLRGYLRKLRSVRLTESQIPSLLAQDGPGGWLPGKQSDPDRTLYICGESEYVDVPEDPATITPRQDAISNLQVSSLPCALPCPALPCKSFSLVNLTGSQCHVVVSVPTSHPTTTTTHDALYVEICPLGNAPCFYCFSRNYHVKGGLARRCSAQMSFETYVTVTNYCYASSHGLLWFK
eukprot:jgi/Botrbrau1/17238/Bobra.0015s0001.1